MSLIFYEEKKSELGVGNSL